MFEQEIPSTRIGQIAEKLTTTPIAQYNVISGRFPILNRLGFYSITGRICENLSLK
jgi:hypothetical protein